MRSRGPGSEESFPHLSLRDLLEARDQYHVHLMRHPNVVATAIGLYRIRKGDSWPGRRGPGRRQGRYARTLENSEVRDYSWPSILVFVKTWVPASELAKTPNAALPRAVYLPDGRTVPICVIRAPREDTTEVNARQRDYPLNNIGGGSPVIATVQGREHLATIACLVFDGHTVYALTNRHVVGEPGEVICAPRGGMVERIGVSSGIQLTRERFETLYPGWPGKDVFINLDVGLIAIDNLDRWTALVEGVGEMGPMEDLSVSTISLDLIGRQVRGTGAGSGSMRGEIHALFYRYQTRGGFEYVADVLIGPSSRRPRRSGRITPFVTLPGDSGTLWLLDPEPASSGRDEPAVYTPIALQWGRNVLSSGVRARKQSYVLATFLARACALLGVDPVRNWNVDQPDTWGAIGHFSVAARGQRALSSRFPKLVTLMKNNAEIISRSDAAIRDGDFTGMGSAPFVPLADVPDFFWKPRIGKQGHTRGMEGPNHFADMDQPGPDGLTLLDVCKDDQNISPARWDQFYDSVRDLMSGDPIEAKHRGLLPFRVWQLFDAMVDAAKKGRADRFVCAAGVLTHYIGDACQPLHISYLHDGDPEQPVEYTFKKGKHAGETEMRPLGQGVHAAYEDAMIHFKREEILIGLASPPKVTQGELLANGFAAAKGTVALMRKTFSKIPPRDIVDAYVAFDGSQGSRSETLWHAFGTKTIQVMEMGCHFLGVLWESAWKLGNGEANVGSAKAITQSAAMKICATPSFVPSMAIGNIGSHLK